MREGRILGRVLAGVSLVWVGFATLACLGGESLREQRAGADTPLEPTVRSDGGVATGALGVDPETETTFVLQSQSSPSGARRRALLAVAPDATAARVVSRLDDTSDVRVLFPSSGVLLMAERGGRDVLTLLDRTSFATLRSAQADVRYHGTRLSPSRRFIAVADNTTPRGPVHVIEGDSLRTMVIPHRGSWLEAQWQRNSDRLVAMVAGWPTEDHMRFVVWDMARVRAENYATEQGWWRGPLIDVAVADALPAFGFGFSWITVAPDDSVAVFPVLHVAADASAVTERIYVLDLRAGSLRSFDDIAGPVGITPDSSAIVGFHQGSKPSGMPYTDLIVLDLASGQRTSVRLALSGTPTYHTTRTGHRVVVSSIEGGSNIQMYDVQMRRLTTLGGDPAELRDFVVRDRSQEIFTVDRGLVQISLSTERVQRVPLGWIPAHLNYLPGRDVLVLDDPEARALRFWSPSLWSVTRSVPLPSSL